MNPTESRGHDGTDAVVPTDFADTSPYLDPQYLIPEDAISHPFRLVSSTAISYIGYDRDPQVLYVCLLVEGIEPFRYLGVPEYVYQAFMEAPSKGAFYNYYVRNSYPLI